nr:hypothetical protein [uncultured Bacteroides sp.]
MYFALEVNETLGNAMRAAAELRAEIGKVIKEENSLKTKRFAEGQLEELYDTIAHVIGQIGEFAGALLADKVFDEADKMIDYKDE